MRILSEPPSRLRYHAGDLVFRSQAAEEALGEWTILGCAFCGGFAGSRREACSTRLYLPLMANTNRKPGVLSMLHVGCRAFFFDKCRAIVLRSIKKPSYWWLHGRRSQLLQKDAGP
jgi:hypothetical protein